jgi:DNA-binding MarR family transcriptional regulator
MPVQLRDVIQGLERLYDLDPMMQISTALTLLYSAQHQEENNVSIQQNTLERTKFSTLSGAAVSRNVKYWSQYRDVGDSGKAVFNYLTNDPDPNDRRYRLLTLTKKGEAFIRKLKE